MNIGLLPARAVGALALSTAMLAGCGGGGVEYQANWPVQLVNQSTRVNGGAGGLASGFVATVNGPVFTTTKPASVQICASGTWVQKVARPASLTLKRKLTEPVQGNTVTSPALTAASVQEASIPFDQCSEYLIPNAGTYPLQILFELSTDCGCTDALASYATTVSWVVRAQYNGI